MSYRLLVCTGLSTLWLLAPACGDDSDPGGGGDTDPTSSTSDASMTSPSTSTTADGSSTTDEDGSSSGSSGSTTAVADSSSSGDLPEEVALAGSVRDFLGIEPLPNVDISVFEGDLSTVSDANGAFEFGGLQPNTPIAFVLAPFDGGEDPSYAGAIIPEQTGAMDRSDVDATMIQQAFIENQIAGLDKTAAEPDLSAAIVVVMTSADAINAGDVMVEMDPPPTAGTFYAPDETGSPVVDSSTIGFPTLPAAVFYNVPDTSPGDITVTATHDGALTCTVNHPQWPTLGSHITFVNVTCE